MSTRAPRLLAFVYSFDLAGSERVGADIAQALAARGWSVEVCATHAADGPLRTRLEAAGIRCFGLDSERRSRLGRRWAVLRLLRVRRPDVLHVQHFPMLALVRRAARLAGVPRIVVTEHTDAHLRGDPAMARLAVRHGRRADCITVIHAELRRRLVDDLGLPAERVVLIPNGVDRSRFRPASPDPRLRAMLGARAGSVLLGCVARLHPDKDHATLFHALAGMDAVDWTLALIGDGPERAGLERLAADLGLAARITFCGDQGAIEALMPQLDLLVLASRTEGLPMVLLEAMACGVPCVATAVGGIPALLADAHGVVVEPANPAALSAALGELLAAPRRREQIAARARVRIARDYDLAVTIDAYQRVLAPPAAAAMPVHADA